MQSRSYKIQPESQRKQNRRNIHRTKNKTRRWKMEGYHLGSKVGDKEDIKRRKELANTAMKTNDNIWKKKWTASLKKRLQLYNSLIKSILLCNCGTWGLRKTDERNLDSLHRKQLRQVVAIKWPHRISNRNLYRITGYQEISKTIAERRWKLLSHILRLNADTPARKSMRYYFEQRTSKKFLGRDRTTIVTTINHNIKRTKEKNS